MSSTCNFSLSDLPCSLQGIGPSLEQVRHCVSSHPNELRARFLIRSVVLTSGLVAAMHGGRVEGAVRDLYYEWMRMHGMDRSRITVRLAKEVVDIVLAPASRVLPAIRQVYERQDAEFALREIQMFLGGLLVRPTPKRAVSRSTRR